MSHGCMMMLGHLLREGKIMEMAQSKYGSHVKLLVHIRLKSGQRIARFLA